MSLLRRPRASDATPQPSPADPGAKYRSIVENAVAGMFQTSPDGRYLTANPALARIYGYDSTEALTDAVTDIAGQLYVDPYRRAEFRRLLQSSDVVEGFESETYRRDGSVIWISESARAVRAPDGTLLHYEGHVQDVTARKQAELALEYSRAKLQSHREHLEETIAARTADLRTLNDQLREEMAERELVEIALRKNDLVATVSHELRTPLASLRGFAELMLERVYTPAQQRQYLRIIHQEATRLGKLIDDFLDLQRMESGRETWRFEDVDLKPALDETLALLAPTTTQHTLRLDVADHLPRVRANADRVRQALVNLIANAITFAPAGGEVQVAATLAADGVTLSVRDQGIGMTPEAMQDLFTRFCRVDNAETRRIGGTGLGLALVKEIATAHGGRVWVESTLGAGSTFHLVLPRADAPGDRVAARS